MYNKSKFLLCFVLLGLTFSCEREEFTDESSATTNPAWFDEGYAKTIQFPSIKTAEVPKSLLSGDKLRSLLMEDFSDGKIEWGLQNPNVLSNAIREGGGYVTVGLKPIGTDLPTGRNLTVEELNKLKTYTVEFIRRGLTEQYGKNVSVKELDPKNIEELPHITLKFDDLSMLNKLRELGTVRYIEPFYEPETTSNSARTESLGLGCGSLSYTTPFLSRGYNSKVSWHLTKHNVVPAWALSTGRNVHIGQIDTGIDIDQPLMRYPKFHQGLSEARAVYTYNLTGSLFGWGHGTGVAGVIAAPVNNNGGMTGVAYQSSLTCYRVNDLPALLSDQAVNDFNTALTRLANNSDIKIINMSVGKLNHKSSMEDAVNYAYSKGKLMFCSTGITGEDGGVYPARFSNTMAVTGVNWNASDPQGLNLDVVFPNPIGSYVDFSVYVQDGDHCVLTMDNKSYTPNSGFGSSQAAATMSGIAALVWSANPYLSREQVIDILKGAASYFRYQNRKHLDYGWGVVDALKAVQDALNTCTGDRCGGGGYNPNACVGITCIEGYVCQDGRCVPDTNYNPPSCPEGCFWSGFECVCP